MPVTGSQPSIVQALLSFVVTDVWVTPVIELHASIVHTLPSSGLTEVWDIPVIGLQLSIVHGLLSSELIVLWNIPETGSQPSNVQTLLSFVDIWVWDIPVIELRAAALMWAGLWHFARFAYSKKFKLTEENKNILLKKYWHNRKETMKEHFTKIFERFIK